MLLGKSCFLISLNSLFFHLVCNDFPIDPKEGYEVNGNGIELNVTFFKENDKWKAILRWDVPMESEYVGMEMNMDMDMKIDMNIDVV